MLKAPTATGTVTDPPAEPPSTTLIAAKPQEFAAMVKVTGPEAEDAVIVEGRSTVVTLVSVELAVKGPLDPECETVRSSLSGTNIDSCDVTCWLLARNIHPGPMLKGSGEPHDCGPWVGVDVGGGVGLEGGAE